MRVIWHPLLSSDFYFCQSWAARVALHHSMFVSIKSFWILLHHIILGLPCSCVPCDFQYIAWCTVFFSQHLSTYIMTNPFPDLPLMLVLVGSWPVLIYMYISVGGHLRPIYSVHCTLRVLFSHLLMKVCTFFVELIFVVPLLSYDNGILHVVCKFSFLCSY